MRRMSRIGSCILFVFAVATLRGEVIRHDGCVVDSEIWSLPKCALEFRNGRLYVSRLYLPLYFSPAETPHDRKGADGMGFAWTRLPEGDWAYFDRTGRVAVRYVAMMDNGPSAFHNGLVRVTRDKKWGLADSHGRWSFH